MYCKSVFGQYFQVILRELLHEGFIGFDLIDVLSEQGQAVLQLHLLLANEVSEDEGGRSALALHTVHQHLAFLSSLVQEPVRDAEVLLRVLVVGVIDLDVQVLEILSPLHVLTTGHVQDVGHTHVN
jgi:CRP-like cAMP-binding protein